MPFFKDVKMWWYSLVATMIGGGAGAVSSGLGAMLLDAKDFNLGDGLHKTLKLMGMCAVLHAALNLFTYLKQSPLPPPATETDFITKASAKPTKDGPPQQ